MRASAARQRDAEVGPDAGGLHHRQITELGVGADVGDEVPDPSREQPLADGLLERRGEPGDEGREGAVLVDLSQRLATFVDLRHERGVSAGARPREREHVRSGRSTPSRGMGPAGAPAPRRRPQHGQSSCVTQ